MPFKPGQSGNPHGRPKLPQTLARMARENTEEWVDRLRAMARDEKTNKKLRIDIMFRLLEHGHGRPESTVSIRRDENNFMELTDAELASIACGDDAEAAGSSDAAQTEGDPSKLN
jgi:hypothetical protein